MVFLNIERRFVPVGLAYRFIYLFIYLSIFCLFIYLFIYLLKLYLPLVYKIAFADKLQLYHKIKQNVMYYIVIYPYMLSIRKQYLQYF